MRHFVFLLTVAIAAAFLLPPPLAWVAAVPALVSILAFRDWRAARSQLGRAVAVLAVAAFVLAPAVAFAADTTVDLSGTANGLVGGLTAIIGIVVTAILGWLAYLLKTKFGLDIQAKHREALAATITNAAHAGLEAAARRVGSVDVKNEALAGGLNYALTFAPGAIKFFGLDARALQQKISVEIAKIVGPSPDIVAAVTPAITTRAA